jgi:hypothetical protein
MKPTKHSVILAALSLFAATAATIATAAAAQAVTITGPGTSLTFSGTGGDFITEDLSWEFDPSNSVINATVSSDFSILTVQVNGSSFWELDLAAPQGQALTAGTEYDNAARYPFQSPTQPGLSLFGDGRGCNTVTGSFFVKTATFGPHGWIQSFDATFVQHCEGSTTSEATGEVVLNNGPPPPDLAVTFATAGTGQVSLVSGQVTLTGTVTCNRPATISIGGTLSERLTRTTLATGNWFLGGIPCDTTPTPWNLTVVPSNGVPFSPGRAENQGSWSAFDPIFQINVSGTTSQVIKLLP